MQMKEMLDLLGITKENLRYYEKMGLVSSSRKENGYRVFNDQDPGDPERHKRTV